VNGSSGIESVTWASSNPHVAAIDQYGNMVSLSMGTTNITVTSTRLDQFNKYAVDGAELTVSEEWAHTNIHPDVWRMLGAFNITMQQYDEQLYFVDSDPEGVKTSSFEAAFKGAWGMPATQVTDLQRVSDVHFSSKPNYSANNWTSAKPSISVSIASSFTGGGALVPLEFTYGMTWSEISQVMGRTVTKIDNVTELFGCFKLLFEGVDGVMTPVVDADGEYGITASKALESGVLSTTSSNNGLSMAIKLYLADVQRAADEKPRLIEGRLIVADGKTDGMAAGSMWLLKRTGSGGGGGGGGGNSGGGGGGCSATPGLAALAIPLLWVIRRKKYNH
jgi:hypothetical protein